uniref:Uncharacterized protein n=1 Tax=Anopheles atroparvus TaxID=41427 RepID=A0AAG5DQ66_ANOAO
MGRAETSRPAIKSFTQRNMRHPALTHRLQAAGFGSMRSCIHIGVIFGRFLYSSSGCSLSRRLPMTSHIIRNMFRLQEHIRRIRMYLRSSIK